MKKCPKTVTGKHNWIDIGGVEGIENGYFEVIKTTPYCEYCGLIDNRKLNKPIKKLSTNLGADIIIKGHGITFFKKWGTHDRPIEIKQITKKGKSVRLLVTNFYTVDEGINWKQRIVKWLINKVY